MANATIKITSLPNVANNLTTTSLFPVVANNSTDKVTLSSVGNLILTEAGNLLQPAFVSEFAYSVTNAAQPNITSVGTLNINTLHVTGGTNGYVLQTDGTGNLSWTQQHTGNVVNDPGGANTQVQYNDAGSFGGNSGFTFNKTSGVLTNPKISTANIFNLNGISVNNGDLIHDSTSQVIIPSNGVTSNLELNNAYGNVLIQTGVNNTGFTGQWQFDNTGTLTFPNNSGDNWPIKEQRYGMGNIGAWLDGQWTIGEFSGNGVSGTVGIRIDPGIEGNTGIVLPSQADSVSQPVTIYSTGGGGIEFITASSNNWIFNTDGSLTLPSGAGFVKGDTNQLKTNDANTNTLDIRDSSGRGFYTNGSGYTLRSDGSHSWIFQTDGNLILPHGSLGDAYDDGGVSLQAPQNSYAGLNSYNQQQWIEVDDSNAYIGIGYGTSNASQWTFTQDGNITLPTNTSSINYANGHPYGGGGANTGNILFSDTQIYTNANTSSTTVTIGFNPEGWAFAQFPSNDTANTANTRLVNDAGNVVIQTGDFSTGSNSYTWAFDNTGNLNLPGPLVGPAANELQLYSNTDILLQAKNRTVGESFNGGRLFLYSGQGSTGNTDHGPTGGGYARLYSGSGGAATAGNTYGAGSGGYMRVRAGGGGDASDVGPAGNGGYLQFRAGSAGYNNGNTDLGASGGEVEITAGYSTGSNQNGGSIYVNTGGADYGLPGAFQINIPAGANVPGPGNTPGGTWSFDGSGNVLSVPQNAQIYAPSAGNITVGAAGNTFITSSDYLGNTYTWQFGSDSNLTLPGNILLPQFGPYPNPTISTDSSANINIITPGDIVLQPEFGGKVFVFGANGNLTVPGNISSTNNGFSFSSTITGINTGTSVYVDLTDNVFGGPITGQVTITGVTGTTQINGTWYYQASDPNQFELFTDNTFTIPVDGSSWGAYAGGGLAVSVSLTNLNLHGENVSVVSSNATWVFSATGALDLPSNGVIKGIGPTPVNLVSDNFVQMQWIDTGNINIVDPNGTQGPVNWAYVDSGGFHIETNINYTLGNTVYDWTFDNIGNLTIPGTINGTTNNTVSLNAFNNGNGPSIQLLNWDVPNSAPSTLMSVNPNYVEIVSGITSPVTRVWQFADDGNLSLPTTPTVGDNTEQSIIRSQRKIIPANHYSAFVDGTTPTATVVYTATNNIIMSIKGTIFIQHAGQGYETFDVVGLKSNTFDVNYSVSNRLNNTGGADTTVSIDLNVDGKLQITLTVQSGSYNNYVTYDMIEFGLPID